MRGRHRTRRRAASRFGVTPSIQMRVGIDVEERRVAELRQRLDDAAAGVEQLAALVGDDDLRPRAACEMRARSASAR